MSVVELTNDNFDQTVADNRLVFIDFWAPWCAPCQSFSKVVEQVAGDYPDITFAKINIEQQKELATEFEVTSIPAVMILRERVLVFAQTGAMTDGVLRDLLGQAKNLSLD